jgi:hypothetical protein
MAATRLARVVLTHSTHVEGLVAALKAVPYAACETLVPGRIKTVSGSGTGGCLTLRVTVPVPGGFRVLAQRGTSLQEVFATTRLSKEELHAALQAALPPPRH